MQFFILSLALVFIKCFLCFSDNIFIIFLSPDQSHISEFHVSREGSLSIEKGPCQQGRVYVSWEGSMSTEKGPCQQGRLSNKIKVVSDISYQGVKANADSACEAGVTGRDGLVTFRA